MGKSGHTAAALEHADRARRGHCDPGVDFPGVHRLTGKPAERRAQKPQKPGLFQRSGKTSDALASKHGEDHGMATRNLLGPAPPSRIWLNAPIERSAPTKQTVKCACADGAPGPSRPAAPGRGGPEFRQYAGFA